MTDLNLYCIILIGVLVTPPIWSYLFLRLTKAKWISSLIVSKQNPWDWFFSKREPLWVIVELTDGRKIGGVFSTGSYASSYPSEQQIYLEKTWAIDENDHFLPDGEINRSKGIIISGKQIFLLKFFSNKE